MSEAHGNKIQMGPHKVTGRNLMSVTAALIFTKTFWLFDYLRVKTENIDFSLHVYDVTSLLSK